MSFGKFREWWLEEYPDEPDDAQELYLHRLHMVRLKARQAFLREPTADNHTAALKAQNAYLHAEVEVRGVECPQCDGDGDIFYDTGDPQDHAAVQCSLCRGRGSVLPAVAQRWKNANDR